MECKGAKHTWAIDCVAAMKINVTFNISTCMVAYYMTTAVERGPVVHTLNKNTEQT